MPQVIFFSMFFKKVEKIYLVLYSFKERFNKMEIKMDLENESQLKRIRKSPLLLSQEELLAEKVKKYSCLFDKSQKITKKVTFFKNFPYPNPSLFFPVLTTFFRSFKNKNSILSNSSSPILSKFCATVIATITRFEHQQVFR